MTKPSARTACLSFAAVLALTAGAALGQGAASYPTKPIQVIVPYEPGGGVDTIVRLIGDEAAKELGQRIVLDNRPGGDTVIGSQALTRAAPDGYTLLAVTGTHVINPWVRKLPYDPIKDFAPVATLIRTQHMLVVNPAFPPKNIKDFIAYAKANGDKINAAATGGQNQIDTLLFMQALGLNLTVVPYKSAAPQTTDLISGRVQMSIKPMLFANQVQSGKLRALVVWRDGGRSPLLPDVPTAAEAALSVNVANAYVVFAPAGTPASIIQKLNGEIRKAQALPSVGAALEKIGYTVFSNSVADTDAFVRAQLERYGKVIRDNNVKLDE